MQQVPHFPTPLHAETAQLVYHYFSALPQIDTVLAVNSCARGTATAASDLDFAILAGAQTDPERMAEIEADWRNYITQQPVYQRYLQSHPFAQIHLDVIAGQYQPTIWDDGGGPDYFEVEIGNQVKYTAPMGAPGQHFQNLQQKWLPFYEEPLRLKRLDMVRNACLYDLDHVPFYIERGLYFQAFDRLYKAFQEFLQALFIARKTYPLAYNKWIREQIVEWLHLPELYPQLPPLLSIQNLESDEMARKGQILQALLQAYCS